MTTGDSLLSIAIIGGVTYLTYLITKKKKWGLVGKIVGVILIINLLVGGLIWGVTYYRNIPNEINELGDIKLGMKPVEVTLAKGKPFDEVLQDNVTRFFYTDYSKNLEYFVKFIDGEVSLICSAKYQDEVFGIGKYDSYKKMINKFGEPTEESIDTTGTVRLVTYPALNIGFRIEENEIQDTCVTNENRMQFVMEYAE